jgi:stage II sporulation protein D
VVKLVPEGTAGTRVGGWRYAGTIAVRAHAGRLLVTNEIGMEEYLAGVVPGEVPNHFAPEAQKALAVAARTYALTTRGRHPAAGGDLCDGPHCQNYLGILPWAPEGKAAVRATRGLIVWHGDTPIRTFYSADCGGRSSNNEDVALSDMPREPLPYLRSVRDRPSGTGGDYCAASPHHSWVREITAARLEALLNYREPTRIGRLAGVRFVAFDVAGRVLRVRLEGLVPPGPVEGQLFIGPPRLQIREVDGWEFRRSLGWRRMKSTLVRLKRPAPDRYRFVGRGFGHGVGLCQIGAHGMASAPHLHSFREILGHYYQGASVAPLAASIGPAAPDRRLSQARRP